MLRSKIKSSLSRDFTLFSSIIIIAVTALSICIVYSIYNSQNESRKYFYSEQADRIDNELAESFDYVSYYAKFLGEKIIVNGNNLKLINDLLYRNSRGDPEEHKLYSWTLFDWITPDNKMVVSTMHGILSKPIDMSKRSYLHDTKHTPWKLFFSEPAVGIPSGQWIIPTGVGVKDKNGKFYGTIGTGFNIDRLTRKLEEALNMGGIGFLIIDKNFNLITSYPNIKTETIYRPTRLKLQQIIKNSIHDAGLLNNKIKFYNLDLTYFKKSTKYPYYVIIGDNIELLNKEFWQITLPRISELIFMGLFAIILLYYFRKRIVKPIITLSNAAEMIAQNKNVTVAFGSYDEINNLALQLQAIQRMKEQLIQAKETADNARKEAEAKKEKSELMASLAYGMKAPAYKAIYYADYLVKNISLADSNNPLIKGWSEVANTAKFIKMLIIDLLNYAESEQIILNEEFIDIELLVNSSMETLQLQADVYMQEINAKIDNNLPYLLADPLRIRQIIESTINNMIYTAPKRSLITLYAHLTADNLQIIIKTQPHDNSIDAHNPQNPFFMEPADMDLKDLGMILASNLMEIHNGSLVTVNEDKIITTTFTFPHSRLKWQTTKAAPASSSLLA